MDISPVPESSVSVATPEVAVHRALPSVGALLFSSWELFRKVWKKLVLVSLIAILPVLPLSGVSYAILLGGKGKALSVLIAAPFIIVAVFAFLWSFAVMTQILIAATQDKAVSIMEAHRMIRSRIWPFIGAYFIYLLVVTGGTVLLVIPGIIFAVWYSQTRFIVLDQTVGVKESLSMSRRYVKGHGWSVFFRYFLIMFIGLVLSAILEALFSRFSSAGSLTLSTMLMSVFDIFWTSFALVYGFELYRQLKAIAPAQ